MKKIIKKKYIDFKKIYEIQARKSKRKPVVEAIVRRCKVSGLRFTKSSFLLWLGDQMSGYRRREGV